MHGVGADARAPPGCPTCRYGPSSPWPRSAPRTRAAPCASATTCAVRIKPNPLQTLAYRCRCELGCGHGRVAAATSWSALPRVRRGSSPPPQPLRVGPRWFGSSASPPRARPHHRRGRATTNNWAKWLAATNKSLTAPSSVCPGCRVASPGARPPPQAGPDHHRRLSDRLAAATNWTLPLRAGPCHHELGTPSFSPFRQVTCACHCVLSSAGALDPHPTAFLAAPGGDKLATACSATVISRTSSALCLSPLHRCSRCHVSQNHRNHMQNNRGR